MMTRKRLEVRLARRRQPGLAWLLNGTQKAWAILTERGGRICTETGQTLEVEHG